MSEFFNLSNPLLRSDPHVLFKKYASKGPIQRGLLAMPGYEDTWYFLGFEEARTLLKSGLHDPLYREDISGSTTEEVSLSKDRSLIWRCLSEWPLFQSPPLHTHRRALLTNLFKKNSVNRYRLSIQAIACDLLDKTSTHSKIEIQQEFSFPLAVSAITQTLGLIPPDIVWFKGLTRKIADVLDLGYTPESYTPGLHALNELVAYVEESVAWKHRHLSDDLLSQLLVSIDGEPNLAKNLVVSLITQMLFAGQETVADAIGNSVNLLSRYPDSLELLRSNPRLIENAIREILRYESSVQFTSPRIITHDMQFDDTKIRAGELTVVVLSACNRDNRRFKNPDHFDIKRDLSGTELSFGHGIHHCLGIHFAHMVMQVALEELLHKLPKDWILHRDVEWRNNATFRGPASLSLSL